MKKKKILILLSDAGNGHRSAAIALKKSFELMYPDQFEIEQVDFFKKIDISPFNSADEMYAYISSKIPLITTYDQFFKALNTKIGYEYLREALSTKLVKETIEYLESEKPDIVITVHHLVSIAIEGARKEKDLKFKFATVITDIITIARAWANTNADLVFCPTTQAVPLLVKYGVNPNKIVFPLFPINPDFMEYKERNEMLKELNLDTDKTTIMITGGGFGNKSLTKSLEKLAKKENIQLLMMCGKNKDLLEELSGKYKNNLRVRVVGFVNNMCDYMSASDIIYGKPGPGTLFEILTMNKKAILSKRIGYQEKGNVKYGLQNPRIRYAGSNTKKLLQAIEDLQKFNDFLDVSEPLRKPDEALQIVKIIKEKLSTD